MKLICLCALALFGCEDSAAPPDGALTQTVGDFAVDAAHQTPLPDLAIALPAHCPCPLGSYCDLGTNSCKRGCLGDDHCPAGQSCDTSVFLCATVCDGKTPCAGHLVCTPKPNGSKICKGCERDFDDCNHNPDDGCETSLNTLTDCEKCGTPATKVCVEDKDQDGYTVMATAKPQCRCDFGTIPSTSSHGEDCSDMESSVHPGQAMFFTSARSGGSFDYDCDGNVTVQYDFPGTPTCDADCHSVFWDKGTPACGKMGVLDLCFQDPVAGCDAAGNYMTLVQACR